MSENFTASAEDSTVDGCDVAARYLETIAGPQSIGDTLKGAINRIVGEVRRVTGYEFRHSRVEDIWRREARRIDWREMDAIRQTARAQELQDDRYLADLAEVHARLAALEKLALDRAAGRLARPRDEEGEELDVVERVLGGEA